METIEWSSPLAARARLAQQFAETVLEDRGESRLNLGIRGHRAIGRKLVHEIGKNLRETRRDIARRDAELICQLLDLRGAENFVHLPAADRLVRAGLDPRFDGPAEAMRMKLIHQLADAALLLEKAERGLQDLVLSASGKIAKERAREGIKEAHGVVDRWEELRGETRAWRGKESIA